jgi:hypothetical protein
MSTTVLQYIHSISPPLKNFDNPQIKITEISNGLALYHYETCDLTTDEEVKNNRGLILDYLDNNRVVRRCLPFIPEIVSTDEESLNLVKKLPFDKATYFPSYETTGIYIFFHPREQKWKISTHKKIDAFDSFWGVSDSNLSVCESFGILFLRSLVSNFGYDFDELTTDEVKEVFDEFTDELNPEQTHLFLISNTVNNRLVSFPMFPYTYHAASIDNQTGFILEGNDTSFPSLPTLSLESLNDALYYANNCDPNETQGVYIRFNNQKFIKIISPMYAYLNSLRNNNPSLIKRFLELRNDVDNLNNFCCLYNEYNLDFQNVLNSLDKSKKNIINCFVERFINGKFSTVSQLEYILFQTALSSFLNSTTNKNRKNKTNREFFTKIVSNTFDNCDSNFLYKLVTNN